MTTNNKSGWLFWAHREDYAHIATYARYGPATQRRGAAALRWGSPQSLPSLLRGRLPSRQHPFFAAGATAFPCCSSIGLAALTLNPSGESAEITRWFQCNATALLAATHS